MEGPPQQPESSRAQPADAGINSPQPKIDPETGNEIEDPLAHMSEIDKWGLKGFSFLMRNYPDYAALVTGTDLSTFGLDLQSSEYVFL